MVGSILVLSLFILCIISGWCAFGWHLGSNVITVYKGFDICKNNKVFYACVKNGMFVKFFRRTLHGGNCGDCYDQFNLSYIPDAWYGIKGLKNYIDAEGSRLLKNKENNMNIFKNNNSIDDVLNKKKQVEELEKKLVQEKETMNKMKGVAKEDLQWILSE